MNKDKDAKDKKADKDKKTDKKGSAKEKEPSRSKSKDKKVEKSKDKKEKKTSKSKEKKAVKRKSSEDEDHVQKPKTAYNIFVKEIRQEVIDENPGVKQKEIFGLVAKKWSELSSAEIGRASCRERV